MSSCFLTIRSKIRKWKIFENIWYFVKPFRRAMAGHPRGPLKSLLFKLKKHKTSLFQESPKTRKNSEFSYENLKSHFWSAPNFLGASRNPLKAVKVEKMGPTNEDTSFQEWCVFKRLQKGPPGVLQRGLWGSLGELLGILGALLGLLWGPLGIQIGPLGDVSGVLGILWDPWIKHGIRATEEEFNR